MPALSGDTVPRSAAAEGRASGSRLGLPTGASAPKAPRPRPPQAPLLSLYSHVDAWDAAALAVASVAALANGATPPAFAFIFGEVGPRNLPEPSISYN